MADRADVTVEAPDGAAALELAYRLERRGSPVVDWDDAWRVTMDDADVREVERDVRSWLEQIGVGSIVVQEGTREVRVFATRGSHVPTHGDFIG